MCRLCNLAEENSEEPPDHVYPKNYDVSSYAMEVDATLSFYKQLYQSSNQNLYLKTIAADNDSSMSSLLKHRSVYPKGRLFYYCCIAHSFYISFIGSIHGEYRPISEGSCPFCRTADEKKIKVNIAVPSGLQSEFHLISDSEVQ